VGSPLCLGASSAGIYVVADPKERVAWVGQTQNFASRASKHLRNGIYGETVTDAWMLEEILVDEWDQDYVGYAETYWMQAFEDHNWVLLNRSRARNPFGGAGRLTYDGRSSMVIESAKKRPASWRAAISVKMKEQHARWAAEKPDEYRLRQSRAGKAANQVPSYEARVKGGQVQGRIVTSKRRQCDECGLESHIPSIGTHQKATGHSGWTDLVIENGITNGR